jgi:hypothetical protein
MSKVTLCFRSLDCGSLVAAIAANERKVELIASYLSDALGDLVDAVIGLLCGADRARFEWTDEPGTYRWVIGRDDGRLDLRILRFDESFSRKLDDAGQVLFHAKCDVLRLATQVKGQMQQLLNQFGTAGYQQRWRHEFPMAEFMRLKELVVRLKHDQHVT